MQRTFSQQASQPRGEQTDAGSNQQQREQLTAQPAAERYQQFSVVAAQPVPMQTQASSQNSS